MNAKVAVIVVILLIFIGIGGFYAGQKYKLVPVEETPQPTSVSTSVPIATPIVDEKEILVAAVRAGLVSEHGQSANSMNITVSKIEGNFAQGSASEEGGGAMWLAAKVGAEWKLVWDGNGTISCEKTDPYDFPVSLVPECWNEATGKLIRR